MIYGKLLSYGDDLSEVYKIWKAVFNNEPGMSDEKEFSDYDSLTIYGLVYSGGSDLKAIAAGKLSIVNNICKIDKIAVLKEYRGYQYGDFIVKMLINKAFSLGADEVTLKTELTITDFFKKIGFSECGDTYEEYRKDYINMKIRNTDIIKLCNKAEVCKKNSKLY